MSTSVLQEGNGANPLLPNVDSIVPGSIFQDDIPPPTFMEGSSGYDPQTNNNTTTTTAGVATSANGRSSNNNNSGGGGHAEIEVNSTIQTVLITLGICVGALFLLGVIATHYISHKNRRAEEKNMKELEKGDGGGGRGLGEALGVKEMKSGGGILGRDDSRRGSVVTVCLDEKMDGGAGVGPDLVRPAPIKSIKGKCFTPGSSSPGSNHSPKGSIIGGVGTAVGGGGHAGTGSFQMGVSGPRGPGSVNPRNSFMEVAMPSALRAATPGYRYEHHHHHHHHAAAPPDLQLGLYADKDPFGLSRSQQQELTSPMFAFSPSGYFGTDHSDRNPFASPPLSAGSKISMLMMDPFRTQNSSQLSLNLGGMTSDDDNSPGLGYDDDDDMFSCRPQVSSITTNNNNNYNYNNANNAGEKVENNNMSNMPLSLQALSPSNGSPRSLDDLSEPKLILRHIHSAVPAYHRQSAMNTASPSSARSVTPNIFNEPPSSPVAVALATAATARVSMERHASFSPGVAHDRRSVACSVVVTSRNERQSSSSSSSSSSGSINEGNAWYRKRASVIIPEGGTAHVRLWNDGEISSSANSIKNRSSRSGSQSSSQSYHSGTLAAAATAAVLPLSPLRLNHPGMEGMENERDLKEQQQQQQQLLQEQEQEQPRLSPKTAAAVSTVIGVARNGAAVFEGKQLNRVPNNNISQSLPSPSPSPSLSRATAFGTMNAPLAVVQPDQDSTDAERVGNSGEQEQVDQVVVRLRTPRRGSHAGSIHSNRQSYLDDYLEQQQQQQQQQLQQQQ